MPQLRRTLHVLFAFALAGALLTGCASTGAPAGPPPEEVITNIVMSTLTALGEGDVDTVMTVYSDDFTWDQGDREAFQMFIQGAADAGFLDGMSSDTAAMAVAVDGDTATVSGVTIEGAFGLLDLTFDLENRDGQWMIVQQTQQ